MEAVAAAASIAGIITVVGQSIDGLIRFSDFFSDVSSASKTITRLLNDINSLIRVLEDIRKVLERARARQRDQNLASLDIKLEDCAKDVQVWLATARLLRPGSESGGKVWIRKFRLAVNSTAIQTIREEIGRHEKTLCLSLEVFGRTLDIDISAQVHQIGGRFNEALSTSLSIRGAQEEALRRIELYSMSSIRSSAHSIRSMDSICTEFRTEVSRLEKIITSAGNTQASEVEVAEPHRKPDSTHTGRQSFAVAEADKHVSHLSSPGPLPGNDEESSASRDSGTELASQPKSLNENRNGLDRRIQKQPARETAIKNYTGTDSHTNSMGNHSSRVESDHKNLTGEVNKVSDLYAEFSKTIEPRRNESPAIENDSAAIHHTLRQSLASIYPPEVVKYVSLRQVTTLCEGHMDFLDRRPRVQISAVGKMKERSYVDSETPAAARLSMIELRNQLVELRKAIKVCREQCIQAGYTLSELDKLLSPLGIGSCTVADQTPPEPDAKSGDDSSSISSEEFHSSAE